MVNKCRPASADFIHIAPPPPPQIEGMRLDKVALPPAAPSLAAAVLLALALVMSAGAWRQRRPLSHPPTRRTA